MEIIITKLIDTSELATFSCGISEIDHLIDEYLPEIFESNDSDIYVVRIKGDSKPCAIFVLSKSFLVLDTYDINELKGDYSEVPEKELRYEQYPAIEIDLLAVEKSLQHKYIGKTIIDQIARFHEKFGFIDELFILVDAYYEKGYSAIPFYEHCGFHATGQVTGGDTMRMFKPLE